MNGIDIDPEGPSLATAVQQQPGLTLESARRPIAAIVIESVSRPPSD